MEGNWYDNVTERTNYGSGVIIFDLILFELCLLNGLCLLIKV